MTKDFHRLPKSIVPKRYRLHLYPNLESFKFRGELEVELDIKEATESILCYAAELEIHSAKIGDKNAEIKMLTEEERVQFLFSEKIQPELINLKVSYSGIHNDKRMGFYRSKLMVSKSRCENYSISRGFFFIFRKQTVQKNTV